MPDRLKPRIERGLATVLPLALGILGVKARVAFAQGPEPPVVAQVGCFDGERYFPNDTRMPSGSLCLAGIVPFNTGNCYGENGTNELIKAGGNLDFEVREGHVESGIIFRSGDPKFYQDANRLPDGSYVVSVPIDQGKPHAEYRYNNKNGAVTIECAQGHIIDNKTLAKDAPVNPEISDQETGIAGIILLILGAGAIIYRIGSEKSEQPTPANIDELGEASQEE